MLVWCRVEYNPWVGNTAAFHMPDNPRGELVDKDAVALKCGDKKHMLAAPPCSPTNRQRPADQFAALVVGPLVLRGERRGKQPEPRARGF